MKKLAVCALLLAVFALSGCQLGAPGEQEQKNEQQEEKTSGDFVSGATRDQAGSVKQDKKETMENLEFAAKYQFAEIDTSIGKIKVKLYGSDSPLTVNNFLKLASEKFYDGTKFHRVIKGFMIQGGDPNSKTDNVSSWGMGGPGYKFKDEIKGNEKYTQGTLAMANAGPNTNGSQFFIVTASPAASLPPSYTVFGEVVSGMDNAIKIENVKTTGSPSDRPLENITIKTITPLEK